MGVLKPDLIFKSIVPIIMAGILGIYGLIVAVILNGKSKSPKHPSSWKFLKGTSEGIYDGVLLIKYAAIL